MPIISYRGFDIGNEKTVRFFEANPAVRKYVLEYLLDRVWRDGAKVRATSTGPGGDIRFTAKYIYAEIKLGRQTTRLRLYDGVKPIDGLITKAVEGSADKYDVTLPIGTPIESELMDRISASFHRR